MKTERWMKRLEAFWFPILGPQRLALLRIATGLFALWYLVARFRMLMRMAASDASLYEPVGIMAWLPGPLPAAAFQVLLLLTLAFNVAYVLGWRYRVTGPGFAWLLLALMCYRNSWSMIYHNYNGLVLHVLVIGLTAAADAWSVDQWRRSSATRAHWRYGWPVMLIGAATAATYLLSGVAKLAGDLAWEWMSGSALRSQVAVDAIRKTLLGGGGATPFFDALFPHTGVFLAMGVLALAVELGAPLALFHRKIAYGWVLLTWGMHWGIWLMMGIQFPYQLTGLIFLSFLPIENGVQRLLNKRRTKADDAPPPVAAAGATLLFDGVCHFCQAGVRFIIARDKAGYFQFASLQSATGEALLQKTGAPMDLSTLVLIEDDRVYTHSEAVLRIAGRLGFPWSAAKAGLWLPRSWRDGVYRWVARRRYRWFGQDAHCPIPPPETRARFV